MIRRKDLANIVTRKISSSISASLELIFLLGRGELLMQTILCLLVFLMAFKTEKACFRFILEKR